MWLFGDSYDHYGDLLEKYHAMTGAATIGAGRGRFGTNSLWFDGSGEVVRAVTPGSPTAGAFLSMAMRITPVAGSGYCGIANLWNGVTERGHVVFRYNVADGTITALRTHLGSLPLQTTFGSDVLGTTPVGLIRPSAWNSVELYVQVHATAGVVRVRINGADALTLTGINTYNEDSGTTAWDGWYLGQEIHSATIDYDDVMMYDDFASGDGITDFLGDLTAECLLPAGAGASSQWTRNTGPTNASCVDDNPADADATYVEDQTIGHVDTYTVAPLARITEGIACVQVVTTARKTTGTRAIAGVLRSGGTNYLGANAYLGTTYGVSVAPFPTDPATSGAWTAGAVASSEIGQQVTV